MTQNERIGFWVHEFLNSSDAILSIKDGAGDHWRVQAMARKLFLYEVECMKELGCLLYLHDGCSLLAERKGRAA